MGRLGRVGITAALIAVTCCAAVPGARAVPLVRIDGSTGIPGGTAAAVLSLADDPTGEVVSGLVGIDFPSPPLTAGVDDCTLAERLSGTHRLLTIAIPPDRLQLSITPFDGTPPLGDGDLASCTFGIAVGTPAGTAALEIDVALADAAGQAVPATVADGAIIIDVPLPTPTVTLTPTVTPTATVTLTPTLTPIPIPSDTPTSTPTATRFVPIVIADNVDGCAVTPPGSGSALPLLGGLALLLTRRRRQRP